MKRALLVGLLLGLCLPAHAVPPVPTFVAFESGQVRPVALTPNGQYLLVTNTPDNRLEVFDVNPGGSLSRTFSIPVGMEPVAVAARTNTEVWVVNHLSDSVSVVDLATLPPRVVRTLIVGDEPRDIVFAGTGGNRAFITTAHRGQQRTDASIAAVSGAGDPQLTTQGVPRADVWVFDATNLGTTFGGGCHSATCSSPDSTQVIFDRSTPMVTSVSAISDSTRRKMKASAFSRPGSATRARLAPGATCWPTSTPTRRRTAPATSRRWIYVSCSKRCGRITYW